MPEPLPLNNELIYLLKLLIKVGTNIIVFILCQCELRLREVK
jgi:hypothetical protein